jgi:hypothetical protein
MAQYSTPWKGLAYTKMDARTIKPLYNYLLKYVFLPKYGQTSAWQSLKTDTARKRVTSFLDALARVIRAAHNSIVASFGSSEVARARADALKNVEWMQVTDPRAKKGKEDIVSQRAASRKEISDYYNGLDEAGKIEALKNTYGMVVGGAGGITQWDLNYAQATNPNYPVNAEYLGELQIGGAYVEQMLTQVSGLLNQEIFAVFSSLKELSDSLNGFFAGGLTDDRKAATAIESAQDIEKKTTELKSEK